MSTESSIITTHPDYIEHRCKSLEEIRKSEWYTGEMIYKMHKATQWYLTMIQIEYGSSFNTPVEFCPYCGKSLLQL